MGDWIKENKFEAGLLLVVAVVAIGAYLLGSKQGSKYTQDKEFYDIAMQQKQTLESKSPYPTRDNEQKFEAAVEDYAKTISGLQDKLLAFRPAEFKQIAPSDFTDKLNAKREALAQRYTEQGIVFPEEKWQLGFERYTATPPKDQATAYLSYQLDALDWLFGALADARPSELVNVVRKELPVESSGSMDGESDSGRGRGRGRGGSSNAGGGDPYYSLPLELTFKASEPAVRKFLAAVAGNDQHFFVIRSMRVQNEKRDKPPKKDDFDFDRAPKGGGSPFDSSFDLIVPEGDTPPAGGDEPAPAEDEPTVEPLFPTEDPAGEELPVEPAAPAEEDGDRILGQILGNEEVYVFLQLDLLLFKEKENSGMPKTAQAQ